MRVNYDDVVNYFSISVIGVAVGGVLAGILLGVLITASTCAIIVHRLTKKASK